MIEIVLLADYPQVIPTLSQWFRTQWPAYYAERTLTDIARDFDVEANREGIPLRLVALVDNQLAGTIALRNKASWTLPDYQPGLGGLFVAERHRRRGVGTELVRAGMKAAQVQGHERAYATTVAARGILERLGWELVQITLSGGAQQSLYQCELQLNDRESNLPEIRL